MEKVLRIGIIGLGRRWRQRYQPALGRLRSAFRISALYDQVPARAAREARRLGCEATAGPTQLLEREDVEAIVLLDEQWFRLWPLEWACQLGKPVLCCCSLARDEAHADALHRQVLESRLPVMMEMLPRFAAVNGQLRRLFETELGAPRLLLCDVFHFGPVPGALAQARTPEPSPLPALLGDSGIPLLDWCAGLLGGEPLNVTARSLEATGFSNLFLEFADQRGVQLTRRCLGFTAAGLPPRRAGTGRALNPWHADRPTVRLQLLAERGSAVVELPAQISWTSHDGFHYRGLRGQPSPTQLLLQQFHQAVLGGAALGPTVADAYRVLRWLRVAVRSRDEGRLLPISG